MTKNLKTINEMVLSENLQLERDGKWYEYRIFEVATGKTVEKFEWKDKVEELYDYVSNKYSRKTEIVTEQEVPSAAMGSVIAIETARERVKVKKPDVFISNLNNEAPSNEVFKKSPPKVHNGFYFPDFTDAFMNRVKGKKNIYMAGASGTGKSEMVQKLADFYGQTLIRINFSQGTTESTLIGKYVVKNGETVFAYGLLPLAMKQGYWILFDEIDYAQPEHTSCMQAVLEGNPLIITQNEGEIVTAHDSFRVFATGNTAGRGDSTDSYHGTSFMNMAFLDRWTIFEMQYSKKEKQIVNSFIADDEMSEKLVKLFGLFRQLQKNGDISNAVFSTRRMINIAEGLKMGDSFVEAIQYELFSRYNEDEFAIMMECVKDIFDAQHYLDKDWRLGMKHHVPLDIVQNQGAKP